jgi:hypothetical protein
LNNIVVFCWYPLTNIFNDFFFLQFIIFYILYSIYYTNNLYYILFYIFIVFFIFGLFIALYNLELFTAFLWLTECVIVFVSILFLFYLNVYGNVSKINIIIYSFKYFGLYLGFLFLSNWLSHPFETENNILTELNSFIIWDNYYESLYNNRMNDFFSLYLSYYGINSFEFICVGLLLLIVSLVCVNLNRFNKNFKLNNYYNLFTIFDFFNDFINFFFLRKQNLVDQEINPASTRIFKKKVNK